MPLQVPVVDNRSYEQLLQEALNRIPVHTPEWTNYNLSDPGVTLVELWAFLTENSLYLSQKIPNRNRMKFLSLLRLSLAAGSAAQGIVTFSNSRGPLRTQTLNDQLEVRANDIPFRTIRGLDVLPVEMQTFYKYRLVNPAPNVLDYYRQLYSSYTGQDPSAADHLQLYETRRFDAQSGSRIRLAADTVDKSLWIALLLRAGDIPRGGADMVQAHLNQVRSEIANRTLSLGVVPWFETPYESHVTPGIGSASSGKSLQFEMPAGGSLGADRRPTYRPLEASPTVDVLSQPGIVEIQLPDKEQLSTWDNLEPLEPGAADFPPDLADTTLTNRLITWLRVRVVAGVEARLLWLGLNAAPITQRSHVAGELLPLGTGEPDQTVVLSHRPVIPESLKLQVTAGDGSFEWTRMDDILAASPEIPTPDRRQAPGVPPFRGVTEKAYTLDQEAGVISFGDGIRGMRPPFGATLQADYDYSVGTRGNVPAGAITGSPALPAGIEVKNEIATWGGVDPQTVRDGEKMITRYLQHRDRLVTAGDFEVIARSAPGVEIGRVEVIPAASPQLGGVPGRAPGAVTLMVIPRSDTTHPYAPVPDQMFLDELCRYLEPRRLITTEMFLRGPDYKDITVSIGISVVPGMSFAQVREAVKEAVRQYLSPLPVEGSGLLDGNTPIYAAPVKSSGQGWPLNKDVHSEELRAAASRVSGVLSINDLLLYSDGAATLSVGIVGLQLPRLATIYVELGNARAVGPETGRSLADIQAAGGFIGVPVTPEECD